MMRLQAVVPPVVGENKKALPRMRKGFFIINLATTYSPTRLP